jgi:hypothetical protein
VGEQKKQRRRRRIRISVKGLGKVKNISAKGLTIECRYLD